MENHWYNLKVREERLQLEALWREQSRKEDIRKELNAKKQSEFNNFKRLLNQSLRWEKSQAIRAFINHVETNPNLTIEGCENIQEWIQWAKCKADWYDPTVERKDEFLSPYGEFHEALLEGKKEIDEYNLSKL